MEHKEISQKNSGYNRRLGEFPENFLWGCATSPTQVEGDIVNEWEDFKAGDGSTPAQGGDHWQNFSLYLKKIKKLSLNSYRLGIDWARLQSSPYSKLDSEAVEKYSEMLASLETIGVTPMLTLFHFACPKWFADMGGWLNKDAPEIFADFIEKLLDAGISQKYWITINEPGVYITMGYLIGLFPPFRKMKFRECRIVLENLAKAHRYSYRLIKSKLPSSMVGISKHLKNAIPHRKWHPLDHLNAWLVKYIFCGKIHEKFIKTKNENHADFIGANYYGKLRLKGFRDISPVSCNFDEIPVAEGALYDDMWEQDIGWMPDCLENIEKLYKLPIFITECGFATSDEDLRSRLLYEHLEAVAHAIERGVDIRGFYYWSFVDNFEWAEGLTKNFGLYKGGTNGCKILEMRPAGKLFSHVARENIIYYNS